MSACSSPYSGWIWCLLTGFLPSSAAAFIGSVPNLSGHKFAYRWRSLPKVRRHRVSKPQGSSKRVLPWQVTMEQLICASLSHTHYWYEVSMLKVSSKVVVVVDSHIQRIVLATEETAVTQQVSHRPIKCQSRLWSQKGTKVNRSHHGDNPLLRPTGIQIATKKYAILQAMAPTNIKTVYQTSLLHIESSLDRLGLLSPTHDQRSQQQADELRSNQF